MSQFGPDSRLAYLDYPDGTTVLVDEEMFNATVKRVAAHCLLADGRKGAVDEFLKAVADTAHPAFTLSLMHCVKDYLWSFYVEEGDLLAFTWIAKNFNAIVYAYRVHRRDSARGRNGHG